MLGTLSDLQRINSSVGKRFRLNQGPGPNLADLVAPELPEDRSAPLAGGPELYVAAVLDALVAGGWEPANLYVVAVSTGPGRHPNHIIAMADDWQGRRFVAGDPTIKDAYPVRSAPYKPVSWRRMDRPDRLVMAAPSSTLTELCPLCAARPWWHRFLGFGGRLHA